MARRRTPHRILLNLALDSALAALALPTAMLLADSDPWPDQAWWFGALPGAVGALLVAGLAVRMPQQYWRYAGLPDLLSVGIAAAGGAALFWAGLLALGAERPANPAFPVLHALALAVLLGLPRVAARIHHARRGPDTGEDPQSVLLVGAGDGADLFIRALAGERRRATAWSASCPCAPAKRGGASAAMRSSARWTRSPPCWKPCATKGGCRR